MQVPIICHVINFQKEFVPQWPPASTSIHRARREGQCGTNS